MLKKTIKQKQKKLNKNNKTDVQKRTYKIDSCKIFLKFHKKTALPFSGHILRSMDMQGQQSQSLNRLSIQAIFLEIKNVQETISKKIDQIPDPINFVIITISQNFDHPGCHARSLVSFQNLFYQKKYGFICYMYFFIQLISGNILTIQNFLLLSISCSVYSETYLGPSQMSTMESFFENS